jgi:hypothetical protein
MNDGSWKSIIKALCAILVIIIIVVFLTYLESRRAANIEANPDRSKVLLNEANRRMKHILSSAGLEADYEINDHPNESFTEAKHKINICTNCLNSEELPKLDKILYVGLHEVSHVINKGKDHDEKFYGIFQGLLIKAVELGYLDQKKLKVQNK